MKIIISIWGKANQGKSSTIRLIYKSLLSYADTRLIKPHNEIISKEIKAIVNFKGKDIGIVSQGDPVDSALFESLDEFEQYNCDIIICSTRSSGGTLEKVKSMKYKGYEIIQATNYRTIDDTDKEMQKCLNQFSATQIIELIKKRV